MITQPGWRKDALLKKFVLQAHPIIQVYIQKLRITELIGTYIQQDHRLKLPIEQTLCVLIHNILSAPLPMYEIADWLGALDESCLGLEPAQAAFVHDDRVGQALEAFYRGRHKDVFFHLALRAIKVFEVDCSQIHQDTTTVTFSGKYSGWGAGERLTHGHNKDYRPDLKQLVLGLSVSADGSVPLMHKIYDGNQTDDRLHPENHRRLRQLLKRSDFVYVADCKLATLENLRRIDGCGGRFVSVMPRTWKEDALFRQTLREGQVQWDHLLSRKNNRQPESKIDRYFLARGRYEAQGYRLLWIRSTQKAEHDVQSRAEALAKALDGLKDLQRRLNTYRLKDSQAIDEAIAKILKQHQAQDWIDYQIQTERACQKHYGRRGRPSAGCKARLSWKPQFSVLVSVNEQAIELESRTDGVFPIITNLNPEDYSAKKVLEIYKFQPFLEKRHSQIKTWQEVTPVLLKKADRVIAYLHMHVMALMVGTLIERQLRRAMRRRSLSTLPLYPEDRPCPYPTIFDIVRAFRGVERYEVLEGERLTLFPARLSRLQKQILEMLEVPISLYQ
jgi:transposase